MNAIVLALAVFMLDGTVITDVRSTDQVRPDTFKTMEECKVALEADKVELNAFLADKGVKAFALQCMTYDEFLAVAKKLNPEKPKADKGV